MQDSFATWLNEGLVLYHGSQEQFSEPQLNNDGILWLAYNPENAIPYGKKYWKPQHGHLWKVELESTAKILDLRDLKNQPSEEELELVRQIKKMVSDTRETNIGYAISDDRWAEWADFGLLEAYPWIRKRLMSHNVDGATVNDQQHIYKHPSVALFNLKAIKKTHQEPLV